MTLSTVGERAVPAATRGRPRDAELTSRLVQAAWDIVADRGLAGLTVDTLVARTGAGRSGVYRRWRCVDDLVRQIATSLDLVPAPPATGRLVEDLSALRAAPLPAGPGERFAAAVWGAAQHDPALRAALHARVTAPLEVAVRVLAARTPGVPDAAVDQLVVVVGALWLQRYLGTWPPMTGAELDSLVREVLAPLVQGRPTPPAVHRAAWSADQVRLAG